jgi:hypothetical protein
MQLINLLRLTPIWINCVNTDRFGLLLFLTS